MRGAGFVDHERPGGIAAPLVALLAFEHVDVLVAVVTVRRHLCTWSVTQDRGACAITRVVQDVNLDSRPQRRELELGDISRAQGPAQQGAHAWSPAMLRPISAMLAVSAGVSYTIDPSLITTMRSESAKTSSRSALTKSTAVPALRAATMRERISATAAKSKPKHGLAAISTATSPSSSLDKTARCTLPPESPPMAASGPGA